MARIHGGQILARALTAEGVTTVFTLTGGHIMGFLDGCVQEGIRVVDVRHEQTAVHAAEAWTRLTGTLGVAAVTAGPGVTDAITGVATAHASGTPLLLLGGRHLRRQEHMGGLQEMDHPRLFGSITAWTGTGWETERLAETVATAARAAWAGRGGPVFLDVPMDVQLDEVDESAVHMPDGYRPNRPAGLDRATLTEVAELLAGADRPVIFAGGGYRERPREPSGPRRLAELAAVLDAPVFLNSRARGCLAPHDPHLGNHTRSATLAAADVVLALGVDWDFRVAYGRTIDAVVIQIDADPTKIGWNRRVDVGVAADPAAVVAQLVGAVPAGERDGTWMESFRTAEAAGAAAMGEGTDAGAVPIHPQHFADVVGDFFGDDAIVAVDGGDIVSTTARSLRVSTPGHLLDPGPFGSLGTGPGYAIAAAVAFPDRRVGLVFGDGGFGFHGFEYDTMVRHGLPVVGVLGNDGVWNNIKTIHQAFFPDRVVAADLGRRPYGDVVAALGGYGETVTQPDELRPALERAAASGLPALVDVHIAETRRMSSNYAQ